MVAQSTNGATEIVGTEKFIVHERGKRECLTWWMYLLNGFSVAIHRVHSRSDFLIDTILSMGTYPSRAEIPY
jgi:hypothetical protein